MSRALLGLVLAIVPAMLGCQSSTASKGIHEMVGKPAPNFELMDLDGHSVSLASLRGRPVVLAFFGYG